MSCSNQLAPPTDLTPMDITDGPSKPREDSDTNMTTPSSRASPEASRQNSIFGNTPSGSSASSAQPSTSHTSNIVKFPDGSRFSSNVIPPTPPDPTVRNNSASVTNMKSSPKQSRPQLTSRLSSRSGGKRHASIGSAREVPLPGTPLPFVPSPEATSSSSSLAQASAQQLPQVETATPSWNARLREMGLHLPKIGSPGRITPRTPRSGSISSGAASPKSPEEQRTASYFSFRRKNSSSKGASPGKVRPSGVTPPPPAPAIQRQSSEAAKRSPPKPSSISEEASSAVSEPKHKRANLSLDLSTTLSSRGSTSSLPLVGHTPVHHLVQDDRPRRASMIAPLAPPPHVHTPPVQPPAYEYPFLPQHPPRRPLEIRVEEKLPDPEGGDGGSWLISVMLPGFQLDGITVGTRRGRVLMIVADNYSEDDRAGHFERRISFGYDADMANIRAEFNGDMLRVTVPRRWIFGPPMVTPRNPLNPLGRPSLGGPQKRMNDGDH